MKKPDRVIKLGPVVLLLIQDISSGVEVNGEAITDVIFNDYYHLKEPRATVVIKTPTLKSEFKRYLVKPEGVDGIYVKLHMSDVLTIDPLFQKGVNEDTLDISISKADEIPLMKLPRNPLGGDEAHYRADLTEAIKDVTIFNRINDTKVSSEDYFTIPLEDTEVWNLGTDHVEIPLLTRRTYTSNKFLFNGRDIRKIISIAKGLSCGYLNIEKHPTAVLGKIIYDKFGSDNDNKKLKNEILIKDDVKIAYEKLVVPIGNKDKIAMFLFGIIE